MASRFPIQFVTQALAQAKSQADDVDILQGITGGFEKGMNVSEALQGIMQRRKRSRELADYMQTPEAQELSKELGGGDLLLERSAEANPLGVLQLLQQRKAIKAKGKDGGVGSKKPATPFEIYKFAQDEARKRLVPKYGGQFTIHGIAFDDDTLKENYYKQLPYVVDNLYRNAYKKVYNIDPGPNAFDPTPTAEQTLNQPVRRIGEKAPEEFPLQSLTDKELFFKIANPSKKRKR